MRRRLAVALVVAAALGPACGRKARPIAPELVQPAAPGDVTAISTPEGVRVSFTRPTHYTSGRRMDDLGRLVIERAPGEGAAAEFVKVGELVLADRDRFRQDRRLSWIDTGVTPGARYLYRVIGVTLDDYESQPGGPVAVRFGAAPQAPAEPQKEPAP